MKSGHVVALPGAKRPEDALKFLQEALATGQMAGVVLVLVDEEQNADVCVFGTVRRYTMAYAGAELTHEAVCEDGYIDDDPEAA